VSIDKNLAYIRGLTSQDLPGFGAKLYETLTAIIQQQQTLAQQVNGNPTGQPVPPPAVNAVKVTGQNGHFDISIQDSNQIYRGIQYFAEYSQDKNFSNPRVIPMGDSRNHTVFLGNQNLYWRAYSSYASSSPSSPAYHGGAATPAPVAGGGSIGGPAFQDSQGSGTGTPGQGVTGPGPIPFRSVNGVPPVR
jgi:hypothetical protein